MQETTRLVQWTRPNEHRYFFERVVAVMDFGGNQQVIQTDRSVRQLNWAVTTFCFQAILLRNQYCDQRVSISVRLSVCLSAHIIINHTSKFHQIFCTYCRWPWLCFSLTTVQYVHVFPVLRMTSFSHIMGQNQARHYVSSTSPGGITGAKSAISDSIMLYFRWSTS